MLINEKRVNDIIFAKECVLSISDWETKGSVDTKTFILVNDGNSFWRGVVTRQYKKKAEYKKVTDSDGKVTKKKIGKETITVIYSHEKDKGVKLEQVWANCVMKNGQRIVEYT